MPKSHPENSRFVFIVFANDIFIQMSEFRRFLLPQLRHRNDTVGTVRVGGESGAKRPIHLPQSVCERCHFDQKTKRSPAYAGLPGEIFSTNSSIGKMSPMVRGRLLRSPINAGLRSSPGFKNPGFSTSSKN